jgi:hypothetical protein
MVYVNHLERNNVKTTASRWDETLHIRTKKPVSCVTKMIRFIVGINFIFFVAFVVPFTNHWIDRGLRALKSMNMGNLVGRSLQIWLVASTLVATILFGIALWRRRRALVAGFAAEQLLLETILITSWWLVVLGACAYAYMLGMGG